MSEPYKSGLLTKAQLEELELSSRAPVEFLQIRPAVIGELERVYRLFFEPCVACGEERNEHTSSRGCEGFRAPAVHVPDVPEKKQ